MYGQLVFFCTKCSLVDGLLVMTRLKNVFYVKILLLMLVRWSSHQDRRSQMRQRQVPITSYSCFMFLKLQLFGCVDYYSIQKSKEDFLSYFFKQNKLALISLFYTVLSPSSYRTFKRNKHIDQFCQFWHDIILYNLRNQFLMFNKQMVQEFIRRCLSYNQAERPDVLTISQDPYIAYTKK